MADLIAEGARTLTFVRSRRGAELTALGARARLERRRTGPGRARWRPTAPAISPRTAARSSARWPTVNCAAWPPPTRSSLGVDIAGLDAVVLAGFPGTVASFWQQAGRSGRRGQGALIVLIARDDPLDTYLVHHPAALLDKPIERVVIDPGNPYVLGPQLLCAATELPLTEAEVRMWDAEAVAATLVDDGLLRRRPSGYFPAPGVDPHPAVDIRGSSGGQIAILETETGRMLGSVGRGPGPGVGASRRGVPAPGRDATSSTRSTSRTASRSCTPRIPDTPRSARELTDIAVTGRGERTRPRRRHASAWCRCR